MDFQRRLETFLPDKLNTGIVITKDKRGLNAGICLGKRILLVTKLLANGPNWLHLALTNSSHSHKATDAAFSRIFQFVYTSLIRVSLFRTRSETSTKTEFSRFSAQSKCISSSKSKKTLKKLE